MPRDGRRSTSVGQIKTGTPKSVDFVLLSLIYREFVEKEISSKVWGFFLMHRLESNPAGEFTVYVCYICQNSFL